MTGLKKPVREDGADHRRAVRYQVVRDARVPEDAAAHIGHVLYRKNGQERKDRYERRPADPHHPCQEVIQEIPCADTEHGNRKERYNRIKPFTKHARLDAEQEDGRPRPLPCVPFGDNFSRDIRKGACNAGAVPERLHDMRPVSKIVPGRMAERRDQNDRDQRQNKQRHTDNRRQPQ